MLFENQSRPLNSTVVMSWSLQFKTLGYRLLFYVSLIKENALSVVGERGALERNLYFGKMNIE